MPPGGRSTLSECHGAWHSGHYGLVMTMTDSVHQRTGTELSAAELHALLKLRVDVFVVEQACPYAEIDGRDLDEDTVHLWFADSAGPTATLRVLADPEGQRIGRVATRVDARGNGQSSRLMEAAIELAGCTTIVLDAQSYLQAFYERFGFSSDGPEFVEDDIPHVPMRRLPKSTTASAPTERTQL